MAVMVLVGACSAAPASPTAPVAGGTPAPTLQGCSQTSVGLTPLSDLTSGDYQGTPGGLYPNRQNEVPSAHLAAGVALARAVGPRDANGQPSAMGRYAFVSIGMSNTTQEFSAFVPIAANDPAKDPSLVVIDGAQGGQTAADWANPGCACWTALDNRLRQAGVSAAQVATAWLKLANRQPSEGWPTHAQQLTNDTIRVLELLRTRFPGLTLAYLSSRIYAGYATTTLNPEPYAYQSGFSVRCHRAAAGGWPAVRRVDSRGAMARLGAVPVGRRPRAAQRWAHLGLPRSAGGRHAPERVRPAAGREPVARVRANRPDRAGVVPAIALQAALAPLPNGLRWNPQSPAPDIENPPVLHREKHDDETADRQPMADEQGQDDGQSQHTERKSRD
jgi:hypothetical protein